ncbi:MAG: glyoxalase [Rhizobiales bacterium 62-17]|nr:VOC family protein [Hyphomicrobiales bacterium]OJY03548.1 MAG: glyoxalase [Rhizobiales bacterium 62-17]
MSEWTGKFCWYELMTSDLPAARKFYGDVIGWTGQNAGQPHMDYWLMSLGEAMAAGMMAIPENACDAGAKPGWIGYIAVDDVDAMAEKVKQKGGKIYRAPDNIPGIGRFAIVADPQGAAFALFKGEGEAPPAPPRGTPGQAGWRELYANDHVAALDFYGELFGWTKADHVDMGDMGIYQLFAKGGEPIGGMMNKMPQMPAPYWTYYFNVEGADAAAARVKAAGGQVLMEPMEVPGGDWIVNGLDPQGAAFNLVAPKK